MRNVTLDVHGVRKVVAVSKRLFLPDGTEFWVLEVSAAGADGDVMRVTFYSDLPGPVVMVGGEAAGAGGVNPDS